MEWFLIERGMWLRIVLIEFGAWSTLAGRPRLKIVLALPLRWAIVRRGRPLPLGRKWPLIIKGIVIECRTNWPEFMFVCCTSTGMKLILLTGLVLW